MILWNHKRLRSHGGEHFHGNISSDLVIPTYAINVAGLTEKSRKFFVETFFRTECNKLFEKYRSVFFPHTVRRYGNSYRRKLSKIVIATKPPCTRTRRKNRYALVTKSLVGEVLENWTTLTVTLPEKLVAFNNIGSHWHEYRVGPVLFANEKGLSEKHSTRVFMGAALSCPRHSRKPRGIIEEEATGQAASLWPLARFNP